MLSGLVWHGWLGLLLAAVLLAAGIPAAADEGTREKARAAHALSRDLMSPFCPGRTLADCPSPDAAAVRQEIRALVDRGVAEAEIRSMLEARYGDAVRGVPKSLWGWLLPGLILLAGAVALLVALRRLSRAAPPGAALPVAGADLERQLDRELQERGL